MASRAMNSNDAGYEERLAFARALFRDTLKLEVRDITPIAYQKNFPFPYNNFVYMVELQDLTTASDYKSNQPGTTAIPTGAAKFILRMPNPASGYNDEVRVEKEIAALALARDALGSELAHLVPDVYAWSSAQNGQQGWMLQKFMPGKELSEDFDSLSEHDQTAMLRQMAEILVCFQRLQLPPGVDAYGSITFSGDGEIISCPASTQGDASHQTFAALMVAKIKSSLEVASKSTRMDGWKPNGVRERLERFLDGGLSTVIARVPQLDKTLVHGDFTPNNMLYDPKSLKLTAIFDFDFAHIGVPASEFLQSLAPGMGRFPSARDGEEQRLLSEAMLYGFPDPLPAPSESIQWGTEKAWDDALRHRKGESPATLQGIQELAHLIWLDSQIAPFKLQFEFIVKDEQRLVRLREDTERSLQDFLTEHGY